MQSRSSLFLLVVLVLTGLSIWGYVAAPYQYGLDVRGGIRLAYEIDRSKMTAEQLRDMPRIQRDLVKILNNRVSAALGVVEGSVTTKGTDQFVIELPGQEDIEAARSTLNTTAKVIVYHAKNVVTDKRTTRRYVSEDPVEEGGAPYVPFSRRSDSTKSFKPGDPEYNEMLKDWDVILEGEDIAGAGPIIDGNRTMPEFKFSGEGSKKLEAWSRRYINQGEMIAFVLDGRVLNIAPLKDGTILKDQAFVDGDFDPQYVNRLTELIKAGSLPVELKEISSQKVSATIGDFALDQMVKVGIISFIITGIFLVVYYAFPGVVALIALCLYVLFTLAVLKVIGATFSLAAITGLILSISMAVDANILVFERFKEEVKAGRKLITGVEIGFKRALSAIFDSNACTILTSLVLWQLGTGPVKGFATTLIIGVAISFLTAIAVTRSLMMFFVGMGWFTDAKYYALNRSWFGENLETTADTKPIDIIGKAKTYFLISLALIIPGLIFIGMGGIKPNVEFQGGYEGAYVVKESGTTSASIRAKLEAAGFEGANIKLASTDSGQVVYITLPQSSNLTPGDTANIGKVADAAGLPVEGAEFTEIGPTIQRETVTNAILGVVFSSALIVLYLAIRFGVALGGIKNGLKFGLSAVFALLHDVVFVVGLSAILGYLFGWEVSALFITAMLTVIGFSTHDTIVIFDRIRENLRKPLAHETFEHVVNKSITQSIARSINTSATAIVTLILLIAFGTPTPELKFMCATMLAGIVIGTYSSIFNAAPILYLWDKATIKRRGEDGGLMGEARREAAQRSAAALQAGVAAAAAPGVGDVPAGSAYGQIKRHSSVVDKASQEIDEE